MFMEALGRLYDFGVGWAPIDINTAGATGKRLSLASGTGVTFLVQLGVAASGVEDVVLTLQQHTAYTAGTTSNLVVCDHYYSKSEALLDNDESWVRVAQTLSQTITFSGAVSSLFQAYLAIPVGADQLSDGYGWVSLNAADPGSASRLAACAYVVHDLNVQRAAANLPNLLRPGAANV